MLNQLFTLSIGFVLFVFIILVIKAINGILNLKKVANNSYSQLQESIKFESLKLDKNNQSVIVFDDLNKSVLNKFLIINREIVLLQKMIFETLYN